MTNDQGRLAQLDERPMSVLAMLRALYWPRMAVVASILVATFVLTLEQPDNWLSRFGGSYAELLTRMWIMASLLTTVTVSCWIYWAFLAGLDEDIARVVGPLRKEIQSLRGRCYVINILIVVLVVLASVAACEGGISKAIITFVAGTLLVSLLTAFDWMRAIISGKLLSNAESGQSGTEQLEPGKSGVAELDMARLRSRRRNDLDVILKLNIPILIGVFITWMLGYVLLPNVLASGEAVYATGFATGATALQVLVGNISFEFMEACS